jgi:hypothetical protein
MSWLRRIDNSILPGRKAAGWLVLGIWAALIAGLVHNLIAGAPPWQNLGILGISQADLAAGRWAQGRLSLWIALVGGVGVTLLLVLLTSAPLN